VLWLCWRVLLRAVCRVFCTGWNKSTGCLEWLCTWVGTTEECASLGKPCVAFMMCIDAAPAGTANREQTRDGWVGCSVTLRIPPYVHIICCSACWCGLSSCDKSA
jgi:hypothetical protein